MDLWARQRETFSEFTKTEVLKMEQLLNEFKERSVEVEDCKKLAELFNRSSDRAGKPVVKWTEIQSWFEENQQHDLLKEISSNGANELAAAPEAVTQSKATGNPKMSEGEDELDLARLEFEARSSKDGAWYDVDTFLSHRFLSSSEIAVPLSRSEKCIVGTGLERQAALDSGALAIAQRGGKIIYIDSDKILFSGNGDTPNISLEILVRYVGVGEEEDEWVNGRDSIRVRSVALEHTECQKVKVGDLVVCFQEGQSQERYYDAHILEIQRKWHDIRGCRCLFLIKYVHDNMEERVRLRRLCYRPNKVARFE